MKELTGFAMFILGLFLVACGMGGLDQAGTDTLSVLYVALLGLGLMLCGVIALLTSPMYNNSRF
jgi:hypothetical protein